MKIYGYILDAVTKKPVSRAHVVQFDVQGNPFVRPGGGVIGSSTSDQGYFEIPDGKPGAALGITHVSYEDSYVLARADGNIGTALIKPITNELPEVGITPRKTPAKAGSSIWAWLLGLGIAGTIGYNAMKGGKKNG